MSTALGNHILVEFMNCDPHVMNDVAAIERDMVGAAQKAGATVINSTFHHFSPYGVSGVVVIQESHLAIHTWPEYGYAAVDLFTCGEMNAWISFDHLKECFGAKSYSALEMKRGSVNLLQRNDFDLSSAREKAAEWRNPEFYTRNVWFTDKDEDQALSLRFTGDVFVDVQSPFQRVRILESLKYGKMLALDDMVMTTEKDEFHYHEMISHPSLFTLRNAKNVLVIGGGDATKGEVPGKLVVDLGGVKVQIWSPGYGHTRGDTIAWVEEEKVLFSGDLVEYEAGVYTGDAQLEEWPATLEALRDLKAEFIVPGRGEAMKGNANVNKALDYTQRWVTTLFQAGKEAVAGKMDLKAAMAHTRKSMDPVFGHVFIYEHCLPFDVTRAYDEASGIKNPRIWTAERDMEMWKALQS